MQLHWGSSGKSSTSFSSCQSWETVLRCPGGQQYPLQGYSHLHLHLVVVLPASQPAQAGLCPSLSLGTDAGMSWLRYPAALIAVYCPTKPEISLNDLAQSWNANGLRQGSWVKISLFLPLAPIEWALPSDGLGHTSGEWHLMVLMAWGGKRAGWEEKGEWCRNDGIG